MVFIFAQVAIAWVYSHVLEYCLHRWLLHDRHKKYWFKTHMGDHHRAAKKNFMYDENFKKEVNIMTDPEVRGLILLAMIHSPIAALFPYAYLTLIICSYSYFYTHRKSHQDLRWARENAPWHYDHHLGKDQNVNWGVRLPIIDWLVGTRVKYKGTQIEEERYNSLINKLRQINELRSHRNKRKRYKQSSSVVRGEPQSRD